MRFLDIQGNPDLLYKKCASQSALYLAHLSKEGLQRVDDRITLHPQGVILGSDPESSVLVIRYSDGHREASDDSLMTTRSHSI
jgi:hypothetical protein